MAKPRAIETVVVRSLHVALAPVGTLKHMTPAEADLMVSIGRAERVEPEQEPYRHRMMVAEQPQARKRGGK